MLKKKMKKYFFRYLFLTAMYLKVGAELFVRLVGPFFCALATGLITTIIIIHFKAIIPFHSPYLSLSGLVHLLFSIWISFNILFNYYMVIFTEPGEPTHTVQKNDLETGIHEETPKKGQGFTRYCKKCKRFKPPRTHHCHICRTCVLRMDHHCPWVSNCVGWGNHKYFVLFLFYLGFGCIWVSLFSFSSFKSTANFNQPYVGFSSRGIVIFTFVMTLAVSLALAFMFFWHLYLLLTNQTTIEFYFNRYKKSEAAKNNEVWENEYDFGYRKNFHLFFGVGKYSFSWLLPSFSPPPGDGHEYPTKMSKDFL